MALVLIMFMFTFSLRIVVADDNNQFREKVIKSYFDAGYTYNLILCFLAGVHGI